MSCDFELGVSRSRPPVPYRANLYLVVITVIIVTAIVVVSALKELVLQNSDMC